MAMKWKDKQKLPSDVCNTCGKPKTGSNSNCRYLCGKCYLKEAKARRKEKGLQS